MARKRPNRAEGRVVTLEHVSKVLAENPLGDPHGRKLHVWLPPQYDQETSRGRGRRFPVLFDLVGYTGSGASHLAWRGFDENLPERAARLIHQRRMSPCILVFPDCFTALGGNQYINSPAIGRYADYLTRELVPLVDGEFRTLASRDHRGCFGKSSGGYGSMLHGMKYPRTWGAIANHSGDAYFDFVYRSDWPNTLNELAKHARPRRRAGALDVRKAAREAQKDGRVRRFLEHVWKREKLTGAEVHALMNLCMAASYDPDPSSELGFRLPFDLETGELIEERWRRWLAHDPVRLVARHRRNLASLRGIWIDCGWRDQYQIHYGARILSRRLREHRVPHVYEEFDDDHSGIDYRMERSLPYLMRALR
ncbi:MAG: alpha/beta hydrolase-fold protein [Myxococcota bacterium]